MVGWLTGLITGIVLAILGYWLARRQRLADKSEQKTEAAAALRFELQVNLFWLDRVLESRFYLRDEAWLTLKNKGYISYLPAPLPLKVIRVYDGLYRLNEKIRVLREEPDDFNGEAAEKVKEALRKSIVDLIEEFDRKFPKIAVNFRT